jgi:hypothetical protein
MHFTSRESVKAVAGYAWFDKSIEMIVRWDTFIDTIRFVYYLVISAYLIRSTKNCKEAHQDLETIIDASGTSQEISDAQAIQNDECERWVNMTTHWAVV